MERLQALTLFTQYRLDRLSGTEPVAAQITMAAKLYSETLQCKVTSDQVHTLMALVPDLKRQIADFRPEDYHKVTERKHLVRQLDVFLFGVPRPDQVYGFALSHLAALRIEMWGALKFPARQ